MEKTVLRRTWAEIDINALRENYAQVRTCTDKGAKLCCVIKADAYGHGAVRVAQELERLGADCFGVSNLEEALQLRQNNIEIPILILGYTPAEHAVTLARANIAQCVYSAAYGAMLSACAEESGVEVECHLKVDTGMNRLGVSVKSASRAQAVDELLDICKLPGLRFTGIFTHFAVSDEGQDGRAFTMEQFKAFQSLLDALEQAGQRFDIRHCANSGAVLDYPETHLDMVRAGIILYGLYPSGSIQNRPPLRPALALKSVVSHVKTIHKGDTVSYGRIFTAEDDMRIAVIPIGYADGYPRILGTRRAAVIISGKRLQITGRVCMDQLMADVSQLSDVHIGDIVTLIGEDGGVSVSADELAACEESINYEVVCDIGKRVPRVYIKDGQVESILNFYAAAATP